MVLASDGGRSPVRDAAQLAVIRGRLVDLLPWVAAQP